MRNSLVIALVALGVVASVHADDGRGGGGRGNGERADHRVLEVFDGKGRAIGPVVSYAPLGTILNVNGISIFAPIQHATTKVATQFSASQFQWATYFFAYLTTDCSGSPLITASSASSALLRPAQLVREGADVTAISLGTPTRRRLRSNPIDLVVHAWWGLRRWRLGRLRIPTRLRSIIPSRFGYA